jgi:hypothetical protein
VAAGYSNDLELLTAYAVEQIDQQSGALAGGNPDRWRAAVVDAGPTLLELQRAGVQQADPYLDDVLAAQGADTAADARVATETFVDQTDGGGSWLRNLVYAPPSAYRDATSAGAGGNLAASRARYVAGAIVSEGVRDMARSAIGVGMFARSSAKSYVRALRGTSCARCAVLAGRHYRRSAFKRHPQCDCYMIPSAEDAPGDWTTDPRAYFNRLAPAQQDALFGGAAAAIRAGADISQTVNAYSGVQVVSSFGRDVRATTSGTSVRGWYGGYEVQPDGTLRKRPRGQLERRPSGAKSLRYAKAPRLLPDEIMAQAEVEGWTREETLRQLGRFGYIV